MSALAQDMSPPSTPGPPAPGLLRLTPGLPEEFHFTALGLVHLTTP